MELYPAFPGPPVINLDRISEPRSIVLRFKYFVQLCLFKFVVQGYFLFLQHVKGLSADKKPTYTKSYRSSPFGNPAQVYIPETYRSGDPALPLIIDIHGGGFTLGVPAIDAADNAAWAHEHGFVVVSIGYRLAPRHPFPTAVHDVADQIIEVLDDKDLPVDRERVAVLGYSAGGNLSLTAVQLHGIHDRVRASVAYYPAVDYVVTLDERNKRRTPHPDGRADALARTGPMFNWTYLPAGTILRQPLLSPRFADREKLPRSLYLLGCEYDMLCLDAWTMAEELADEQINGGIFKKIKDSKSEDPGWECGRVRWKLVRGVEHGFNTTIPIKRGAEKALYQRKAIEYRQDVAQWLHRVAFAK